MDPLGRADLEKVKHFNISKGVNESQIVVKWLRGALEWG